MKFYRLFKFKKTKRQEVIDKETGEPRILKHINKLKIDKGALLAPKVGGWNKSGAKGRKCSIHKQNRLAIKSKLKSILSEN